MTVEAGGLEMLPTSHLAVSTRRGDVKADEDRDAHDERGAEDEQAEGPDLVGVALLAFSAQARGNLDFSIIAFGLKATVSAVFALLHLRLVGKVLQALGARGLLRS